MVSQNTPILDTMRRTVANLEIVEGLNTTDGMGFEVTQLVNSFAGVVLYPWEEWKNELRDIALGGPQSHNWPNLVSQHSSDERVTSVGDAVRLVRNAFAHGNIIFQDSGTKEITSLTIWNTDPATGLRTWSADVTIPALRLLLKAMCELAETFTEPKQKSMPEHISTAVKIKKPQCPTGKRTVKRGHALYQSLVTSQQKQAS